MPSSIRETFCTRSVRGPGGLPLNLWERKGEGPRLLLLHGFLDSGASWARVTQALPPDWWVVAPDFRGHGLSGWVPRSAYYHFPDYLRDTVAIVDELGWAHPLLCGHSMGGTVALQLAGTLPQRFRGLALLEGLGPPHVGIEAGVERTRRWLSTLAATRPSPVYKDVDAAAARLVAHNKKLDPALARELAEVQTRCVEGGVVFRHDPLHLTRAPVPFDRGHLEGFAAAWSGPVSLVFGGESWYQRPDLRSRIRWFDEAAEQWVPETGHMLHTDAPEAVAGALVALSQQAVVPSSSG